MTPPHHTSFKMCSFSSLFKVNVYRASGWYFEETLKKSPRMAKVKAASEEWTGGGSGFVIGWLSRYWDTQLRFTTSNGAGGRMMNSRGQLGR